MNRKISLPKIILSDIDGVWTDGGMYYDQMGNELKKFHTYDSAGVLFAHRLGIPVGIITGEETEMVKRRAEKLGIDYLYQGVTDKLKQALTLIGKLNVSFSEVAYIGDDINDIMLLSASGISATPHNAPSYVKKYAKYSMNLKGGEGVFRVFVEFIINNAGYTLPL